MRPLYTLFVGGFLVLFLFACASAPDIATHVEPGMDAKQVQAIMGKPEDKTFRGKRETWAYPTKDGKKKVVIFEHGKVVELLNADPKTAVMHEVGKKDPTAKNADHCVGSNRYGKFPKGGGCNLYGCYPAGGYCNQWGCSASGRCTVSGCPSKITSYKCLE